MKTDTLKTGPIAATTTRIVAKVVITDTKGEILILRRSISDALDPGTSDFPGGRAEAGESIIEAAIRETVEETGIELKQDQIKIGFGKSIFEDGINKLLVLCTAQLEDQPSVILSAEHDHFSWHNPDDLHADRDKMHHPVWAAGVRYLYQHNLL